MGRQPRMGLLRLLLRVALVLVALTAVGRGTGTNYLQPIFTSMGSQRYATPPPADPRLHATGDVRVVAVDNPQVLPAGGDVQAALDDVLAIKPAIDAPASATVAVSLSAANFGANRLHAFVRFSADYASSTDSVAGSVTAVLAPENAPSALLREVQFIKAPDPALTDEWHEVLGDFHLVNEELGEEGQRMHLYVTLGVADATAGSAWLTALTVEHLATQNVALLQPIVSSVHSNDDSNGAVLPSGLTDASTTSPTWTIFDTNPVKEEVWFVIDLDATYVICSARVHFTFSARVSEWKLFLDDGELSNNELWQHQALHIDDRLWPTSKYTSDTAMAVMTNDDWTPNDWAATIWRYQQLDDNPISSNQRFFSCSAANRAKLSLLHTNNVIFALMEIELFGYELDIHGPCALRCRHGGQCTHQSESFCTCPSKWGWRGVLCEDDVNECELDPSEQTARDRVPQITAPNGGCGGGSRLQANCTNTPGSWNCTCRPGFSGDSSTGESNTCVDINECLTDRGGCKDICLNSVGSYQCACNDGYELATGSEIAGVETNNTSSAETSAELIIHRVTQLPLLGAACQARCDQECRSGFCTDDGYCTGCNPGWHGRFCDVPACTSDRKYKSEDGSWYEDKGCYHGGQCIGAGCSECLGGWTGVACESAPGGLLPLLIGMCSALQILPCLLIVLIKRSWPPFQERDVSVLMLGGIGAFLTVSTSPASSNPGLYGIPLDAFAVQPESQLWGHWLPFVAGYALWFTALLVRVRNLVIQHVRGGFPAPGVLQIPVAWAPWAGSCVLPVPVGLYAYVCLLVLLGGYFAVLSLQLLPLRRDLDDLLPTMILGICATGAVIGQSAMILGGASYANPQGSVHILFPALLSAFVGVHFFVTVSQLVWKLLRKDQKIMERYDVGTDSEDDSDEESAKTSQRWKKGIGGAKTAAILKLSTDGGAAQPAGKGLFGMLSKKQKQDNEAADQDREELSSSESEYYESSSTDEEEEKNAEPVPKAAPVSSSYGSSAEVEQSSDSESDGSTPDSEMPAVGRGSSRGQGRAAGRGRWSRGSRASFNRGRGTGRSASRAAIAPVGVPLAQTTKSAKPQLKAAALLAKVQRTVVAPATESSDDLTSSDDDELEQLAQEVKRFEKMMHKKIAVPGFVPVFTAPEQGKGASEQLTLDTIMQKRILQRERQLYNPEEADLNSIAGYEMTEMEKLAAGKQQPVAPTKDIPETATQQRRRSPSHAAQKVLSETDEDIEIEISGETYLVDLESGLVFHLVASGEPPEVGTWDSSSRLIVFG